MLAPDTEIESKLDTLLKQTVQTPVQFSDNLTTRMDNILLHPWLGLPIFFGVMYLLFQAIFLLGGPLQEAMQWLLEQNPDLRARTAAGRRAGRGAWPADRRVFITASAQSPVLCLLSFCSFCSWLSSKTPVICRARQFLMDALMAKLGLDGRAFVMMLNGIRLQCAGIDGDTRVMRSRGLRLLSMLVIPFSLCSARLQVFIFITAALFSPKHAPLVLFSLYLFSFATAFGTALLFKRRYT